MYIRRVKYPTSQEILYLLFFKVYREHLKNLQHKFLVFLKVAEPFRNLQNVYFQSEISHEREFLGLMALVTPILDGYTHSLPCWGKHPTLLRVLLLLICVGYYSF